MKSSHARGFTFIEVTIVMAITATLLVLAAVSLISFQQNTFVSTTSEQVISDLKYQQLAAMNGVLEGESTAQRFGIHFDDTSYTLFHGDVYTPGAPTNFAVAIQSGLTFGTVLFPSREIMFEKGSGEVVGFVEGQNLLTINDTGSTKQVAITLNNLGTIIDIQESL